MAWYKRVEIPIAITVICAFIQIIPYFFNVPAWEDFADDLVEWQMIVGTAALFLGAGSLLLAHIPRVQKKRPGWEFSALLLALMIIMIIAGLPIKQIGLGLQNPVYQFIYRNMTVALSSTMYSILAFFITSAAYRAFRARNIDAAILLVAGTLVMLGNAPAGTAAWLGFGDIKDWLFKGPPNLATMRAIRIGAALGAIVLAARTFMGVERGYLRGGGE
ncbi:MAG: hypothetical protein DRJ21_02350 [Candidatus Methanomethylicota archaeon]|uniref:Uncharacterized protein n=1 Tax=Thermoproteota archaeon TaxID=2056631 RepID=A0A497EQN8_9CREN|nr:MAG: hypothetical protein DRJ21_02350 [Candidatus Verstraetearchaeota archaeon]